MPPSRLVKTIRGQSLPIIRNGSINFTIDGIKDTLLYVPVCHKNLLSVEKLADRGLYCLFTKEHVFVLNKEKKILGQGFQNTCMGLYSLLVQTPISKREIANLCQIKTSTNLST